MLIDKIYAGTIPPEYPEFLWFQTNTGIQYLFDETRNCWISTTRFYLEFGDNGAMPDGFLKIIANINDPESSYLMIRDAVITAISATITRNKSGSWPGFNLLKDYVDMGPSDETDTEFDTALEVVRDELNWHINKNQRLSCYMWSSNPPPKNPHVWVEGAWRYDPQT